MMIDKNSWHYKVWEWSYTNPICDHYPPSQTNLCSYMRRILLLTPLNALLVAIGSILYTLVVFIPVVTFRWCIGYKTTSLDITQDTQEYNGLRVANKVEIYPWHVLVPAAFIGIQAWAFSKFNPGHVGIFDAVLAGIAAVVVLTFFMLKSDKTEVFRDWFWARKQKICPTIEFGDHNESV